MGTLKRRLASGEDLRNPGVVKVVTDEIGKALYLSRAPIPHIRDKGPGKASDGLHYVHLGIYIFTRETLLRFSELPTGTLEGTEQLEQFRAIEHGIPIRVWETLHPSLRVDTPEDLKEAAGVLDRQRQDRSAAHR